MNIIIIASILILAALVIPSISIIGPTQVGLVTRRFSFKRLSSDNPIAFRGEAGYQARLLMPGWRFKLWILYGVEKHPWVQIPAGNIGVVVAQVGLPLPTGAKSGVYHDGFGNYCNLEAFISNGGQKGVQRPVLPPGTLAPIHPVAFLVITADHVYGVPILKRGRMPIEFGMAASRKPMGAPPPLPRRGELSPASFGLRPEQLKVLRIGSQQGADGKVIDMVGVVTVFEGDPLPAGDIASRLGGFADISELEQDQSVTDHSLIEAILGSKNQQHNNYQNFQSFLDSGGRIGLQHDPLLYGAYNLNPFLVSVELVPMLVVEQGQVAVVKSYVGLVTQDTSGVEFKFGSLVRPGHRGIWQEPLRTGKYPINPHIYQAEIVPTAILTLNWADRVSHAHDLDAQLSPIIAKSREGFEFSIDLQVQIHVADTQAPWVISMVGTMQNLVNEVLQAAVGNHFRDKLQSIPAIRFIETRQTVQIEALGHIQRELGQYKVEAPGVYIQDVILPGELVKVLTEREIANQEVATYRMQEEAQRERINMEKAKGTADMQNDLAQSQVSIAIKSNNAQARKAEADGEAEYIEKTGAAHGARERAVGMARADSFKAQVDALGMEQTALVNIANALAGSVNRFVPEVFVGGGGSFDGLAAMLTKHFMPALSGAGLLNTTNVAVNDEVPGSKEMEEPEEIVAVAEDED
ncbi:MAG: SPFH domain-containing protein [Pontiellaceae bacterium]|nr:SPFH domain-containing protein [Pontiellaceae bacterium]MBN2785276.1 SPFH domain-containing protein [Pontiellaceae bacterium]